MYISVCHFVCFVWLLLLLLFIQYNTTQYLTKVPYHILIRNNAGKSYKAMIWNFRFVIIVVLCLTLGFLYLSQLMRLWYLSHWRPAKAQAILRIRAVSQEPLLFAHMKYGSRRRVRPKIRHLAPLDGCACARFEN